MLTCMTRLMTLAAVAASAVLAQDTVRTSDGVIARVETVLSGLEVPWAMRFAPNGDLYFTERPGRLNLLPRGATKHRTIARVEGVRARGEGGLMGLALHPRFTENGWIYMSLTTSSFLRTQNQVVRYTLKDGKLEERTVIIDELPGSSVHNGCRLAFGADGSLFVSTGDATDWDSAQKLDNYGGKILRVTDEGIIPADNPFGAKSPIYAVGVRNPQGLVFDPVSGWLFETEHGPSGFEGRGGGGDEVNIIKAGENYGWPVISHRTRRKGLISPLLEYSPAVAPAGAAIGHKSVIRQFEGNLFFGCLRGNRIQRVVLDSNKRDSVVREESLLTSQFGRVRDVVFGPDGFLYFATSNRDGRGDPMPEDDRICRMIPVEN